MGTAPSKKEYQTITPGTEWDKKYLLRASSSRSGDGRTRSTAYRASNAGKNQTTQRMVSIEIEKCLERDKIERLKQIKLLLLGGAESGKSTIVKQMKILHMNGFSESELMSYNHCILSNIQEIVKKIISLLEVQDRTFLQRYRLSTTMEKFMTLTFGAIEGSDAFVKALLKFRNSNEVQKIIARACDYGLPDNAEYFLSRLESALSEGYIPTEEDILQCRVTTTGVYEVYFQYKDQEQLRLIDVGGQRTERRKWIHCFEDVACILFVLALSGYDQTTNDGGLPNQNRLKESISLFRDITGNRYLMKSAVILFLNKVDVFERKLKHKPITCCFSTYTGHSPNLYRTGPEPTSAFSSFNIKPPSSGSSGFVEAANYVRKRVLEAQTINAVKREVFPHFTNATDTRNVDLVFSSAMESVILKNLNQAGMT